VKSKPDKQPTNPKGNPEGLSVLWAGRLAEKPGAEAFAFQASIAADRRLALEDIEGSRAHAAMLAKQGIIPAETAAALDAELTRIAGELAAGKLTVPGGCGVTGNGSTGGGPQTGALQIEDIHSFIEGLLTERLGDAGRMVHAGRSRNDQVATDLRLYLKRAVPELRAGLAETIAALLDKAEEHSETVMPGYTHLQRAQPVTAGFQLCAWAAALKRDRSPLRRRPKPAGRMSPGFRRPGRIRAAPGQKGHGPLTWASPAQP